MTIKSRILCTDAPQHARHEVVLHANGTLTCDCHSGVEDGKRLGAAVALGTPAVLRRSCAGLIAFLTVGLPRLVASRAADRGAWGGWKDAWATYCTNALVREVYSRLVYERDVEHVDLFKIAAAAMKRCGRYRSGMEVADFMSEVSFIPNAAIEPGAVVALYSSDSWSVPLQSDWLESVGKAKPVIDGKFIVGVGAPGFVYAISGNEESGFTVEEFAVIGDKLGKIARAACA